ncbi:MULTISPECIES: efflux RND transporter periplasmic adaptor subunit [unclassified Pseudomonas]|uniref:efflux RND transporter periplasmic adaptor subunit n=1 Tax=unclassified Pseudomonas TaxID=196821 RepID=UPI000CD227D4|nr:MULTISPECIES: biotin/lipoyl-binding protein [unclassified Pseudomonas]POA31558.1 glycosyl hydrolase family 18 [Pseudomonas sp. GW456-R21]POA69999.1 glycosyl hydrolase family 18 [Pseudomonas sp. GW460-R15]
MKNRVLFVLAVIGVVAGVTAAYLLGRTPRPLPPAFAPASSTYDTAIYANGIIESEQPGGSNIVIYPQVSGPITQVLVQEGQAVTRGTPLVTIDDAVSRANFELAQASLKTAQDQYTKRLASYGIDPKSISKDTLDTAKDTAAQAQAALKAANATLAQYAIKAPVDGVVLAINTTVGSYVSPQGAYDPYIQQFSPLAVMSAEQTYLAVRCYVDEILIARLPPPEHIRAQMLIHGSDIKVPLEFVRVQPYVSPKIQLSNQRQEKVDLRVLPVVFRFEKKDLPRVYPGQLVDVFIGHK